MITALFSRKRHHINSSSTSTPRNSGYECSSHSPTRKKSRLSPLAVTNIHQSTPSYNKSSIQKLTQHQSILQISHTHLQSTTATVHRCKTNLQSAQSDYINSQQELQKAREWSNMVESRWGVIDCDGDHAKIQDVKSDESSMSGSDAPITYAVSDESEESDFDESSIYISQTPVETTNQIEITSGEDIVNGTYRQLLFPADNHESESIYIHNSGPFLIPQPNNEQYYDVCLYKKWGYGDKMRWCIGLVPVIHSDATNVSGRKWDFDRVYIYYWMEVSLFPSCGSATDDDRTLFRREWSACHGMRPVPSVREAKKSSGWLFKLASLLSF